MEKQILLIDDNLISNSNYINRLKTKYTVDDVAFINTAIYKLKHPEKYKLVIVDIMMPTLGIFTNEETNDGLTTGLVFYEKHLKELDIKVLFWSRHDFFQEDVKKLDNPNASFVLKEYDENHLLEAIIKFLKDN